MHHFDALQTAAYYMAASALIWGVDACQNVRLYCDIPLPHQGLRRRGHATSTELLLLQHVLSIGMRMDYVDIFSNAENF